MKNIAIVAGGNLSDRLLSEINKSSYVVGVDRGAYWLIFHGIKPDLAIGDFDSVTQIEFATIKKKSKKILTYAPEKNWTDLELAVDTVVKLHPTSISIFGGFGTRLDHSLGAIHLLETLARKKIVAIIIDENNSVSVVNSNHVLKKSSQFSYVSVLPVTASITISLKGFKYNVSRKKIAKGTTIGISNEIEKDEGTIEIHAGTALLIQSRD